MGLRMKIEEGVMIVKDGKAWGKTYEDGRETNYGWMNIEDAQIHDPKYCKKVTDVTYKGSHYESELLTGKLVKVRRSTVVEVVE